MFSDDEDGDDDDGNMIKLITRCQLHANIMDCASQSRRARQGGPLGSGNAGHKKVLRAAKLEDKENVNTQAQVNRILHTRIRRERERKTNQGRMRPEQQ